LRRFGVSQTVIAEKQATAEFRELMRFEVERAREWFRQGLPLVGLVHREVARDLELFSQGGMEILDAIEASGYDVLSHRPTLSKNRKLALLARAAWSRMI
jgi:phytoene/squalene synthetase